MVFSIIDLIRFQKLFINLQSPKTDAKNEKAFRVSHYYFLHSEAIIGTAPGTGSH